MINITLKNNKSLAIYQPILESNDFIPELQTLEKRLAKIKIPESEHFSLEFKGGQFRHYIDKIIKKLIQIYGTNWIKLERNIKNSKSIVEKKEALKDALDYLKKYIEYKDQIYCGANSHTDILNIYWFSKAELEITEKIYSRLHFFNGEITRLES